MNFRHASNPRPASFTLIELMVVLVLIGIMTAMIVPEMKGTLEDAVLRATSRELVDVLSLAASRAVSLNEPERVSIDRTTGKYVVEKLAGEDAPTGSFVPLRNIPGSQGQLDPRVSLEIVDPDADAAPDSQAAAQPVPDAVAQQRRMQGDSITFYPDGTADERQIVLKDRDGFRLALRVNPTTGRVNVSELERAGVARP